MLRSVWLRVREMEHHCEKVRALHAFEFRCPARLANHYVAKPSRAMFLKKWLCLALKPDVVRNVSYTPDRPVLPCPESIAALVIAFPVSSWNLGGYTEVVQFFDAYS